ncbi:MAG: c-type cytochrome biogenesis protein CcsB [Deltaproteobacteria bacterium]|nr:MAG: c-type cytochrome biogenesis protein CcsB [Deltaproteobacteria bacterium]
MEILVLIACGFYFLSAAGYLFYLIFQKNYLQRVGFDLLLAGFICHTIALGLGWFHSGVIPVRNLYETLLTAGWATAGIFLVFSYRLRMKIFGIYAAPLITLIMIVATQVARVPVDARPLFNNFWLVVHILTIFLGEAALALAGGAGVLYLIQEQAIKTKRHGFFYKRLPSLELLDGTGYACLISGFTLMTFGLVTGIIYAKSVWGHFWSWDPKEIWAGITWLLYAALLHERLTVGWRGRRSAILAIIGFAVIVFTFLGVNFFLQGHHGEFTRL